MGVSAYLSFIRGRRAWALIRGWALINFFCLWDGRLFEVGANSRLGAYSNKYGTQFLLLLYEPQNSFLVFALLYVWRDCLSCGIFRQNLFHSIIVSRMGSWVNKLLFLLCFLYCKNDCIDSKNVWFLGGCYYLHFSQSPLRKIVRIERLPARYVWPS